MNSFFLFEQEQKKILFHAEYCTVSAVHTHDGYVFADRLQAILPEENILLFLTKNFSTKGFFEFLQEHGIEFVTTDRTFADTSADI